MFHLTHFYYKSISLHGLYWPASIQMRMHSLSFSFSHCHSRTHSLKTLSHMFAGIAVLGSNLDHYIKLPTCRAKRRAAFLQYLIRILRIFHSSYCNSRMPFSACVKAHIRFCPECQHSS